MAPHAVPVIGAEDEEGVVGEGGVIQGVDDPADVGVDHLHMAGIGPAVVAPLPGFPLGHVERRAGVAPVLAEELGLSGVVGPVVVEGRELLVGDAVRALL